MNPNHDAEASHLPVPAEDGADPWDSEVVPGMTYREFASFQEPHCYICEVDLLPPYEMDHFPIPKCSGGVHTRRVCKACHDMKDRASWFGASALQAEGIRQVSLGGKDRQRVNYLLYGELAPVTQWVEDIWGEIEREGRIFAARTLRVRHMQKTGAPQPQGQGRS